MSLSACVTWKLFRLPDGVDEVVVHKRFRIFSTVGNFPMGRKAISDFYVGIGQDVLDSGQSFTARQPDSIILIDSVYFRTDCMSESIVLQLAHRDFPQRHRPHLMYQRFEKQHIDNNCAKLYLSFDAVLYSIKRAKRLGSEPVEMILERRHLKDWPMF
jgi:hypothetical protein